MEPLQRSFTCVYIWTGIQRFIDGLSIKEYNLCQFHSTDNLWPFGDVDTFGILVFQIPDYIIVNKRFEKYAISEE